jgi:hypothetical protein
VGGHDPALAELLGSRQPRRAGRRAELIALYDEQFAALEAQARRADFSVLGMVETIASMHFDKRSKRLYTYVPNQADLRPIAPYLSHDSQLWYAERLDIDPPPVISRVPFQESEPIGQLTAALRANSVAVRELRQTVGEALRRHFAIDDLL